MYLPTSDDWKFWKQLMGQYSGLVPDTPILNTLAILIALREWSGEFRAPTRSELHRFLFESGLEGFSPWHQVLPDEMITESGGNKRKKGMTNSSSHTTEHLLLKKLEDIGLIKSETFKAFRDTNNRKHTSSLHPRIQERMDDQSLTGKELLYSLTPVGSLYLELVIQKPWLYHGLNRNAAKRGFVTISILSWSYLKDDRRTEGYLKNLPENKTIIKNIGFKNYPAMLTTTTRIISEYHCLKELLSEFKDQKSSFEVKKKSFESILNTYHTSQIINDEFITITEAYLSQVIREAEKKYLTIKDLESNAP